MTKRNERPFSFAGYNPNVIVAIATALFAPSTLSEKIAEILPTAQEEKWLTIPWRTNLASARIDAQRENKPLFMWIMNGHPMGCT